MKTVNVYGLLGLVALAFVGSAMANPSISNQNIARRSLAGQPVEKADQAWVGASLQTTQKQILRTNLQYVSKRAYQAFSTTE